MFVFEDLLNLDTEYIMKILQNVETADVVFCYEKMLQKKIWKK